jgi:SPP1 gp7 family putative phage head morphogenesis protein
MVGVHRSLVQSKDLEPTFKEDAKGPSDDELNRRLQQILRQIPSKVGPKFERLAKAIASKNKEALAKAVGISAFDLGITPEIAAARDRNIRLVEDAARAYAQQVREIFDDPDAQNLRVEELKAKLLERADVSKSRAELIARDQILKLNGRITQIRQQMAGVQSYVWSTSKDERVRESHQELEGETFSWSAPPSVGHPGEDFQCRCIALPLIPGIDD